MKQSENIFMQKSGIEILDQVEPTISAQLELRRSSNRYYNRALRGEYFGNPFANFPPDTLNKMKEENDYWINKIIELKASLNIYNTGKVVAHFATDYEVGAIIESNWGYEQTNVDFYCIVHATEKGFVFLQPMTKKTTGVGDMVTKEEPGEIIWHEKPIMKRLRNGGFSMGHGWAGLWDGQPSTATHYA